MTGQQHVIIGIAIGAGIAVTKDTTLEHGLILIVCGAISALIADIDGRSMISRHAHRVAVFLKKMFLITLGLLLILQGFLYYLSLFYSPLFFVTTSVVFGIFLILSEGIMRHIVLSIIGVTLMMVGSFNAWIWLIALGLFISITPWFKHRGFTHTIWSLLIWIYIFYMLEQSLAIEYIALVAGLGYFSHLIADSLSLGNRKRRGVRWFYPLWNKELRL